MNGKMKAALSLTDECPSIEQLAALRESAHVSQCLHCQAELAMLEKFENATADADEKSSVEWIAARLQPVALPKGRVLPFPTRPETRIWLAAAACLLLAVSGVLLMRRGPGEPLAPQAGTEILRTQSVDLVAPLNDVLEVPGQFTWQTVAGAVSYRVRLVEIDRTELWSTVVSGPSAAVPAEVKSRMRTGTVMLWEVSARDAAGVERASSGTRQFRIIPRQ